jgi:hypothetical protein
VHPSFSPLSLNFSCAPIEGRIPCEIFAKSVIFYHCYIPHLTLSIPFRFGEIPLSPSPTVTRFA